MKKDILRHGHGHNPFVALILHSRWETNGAMWKWFNSSNNSASYKSSSSSSGKLLLQLPNRRSGFSPRPHYNSNNNNHSQWKVIRRIVLVGTCLCTMSVLQFFWVPWLVYDVYLSLDGYSNNRRGGSPFPLMLGRSSSSTVSRNQHRRRQRPDPQDATFAGGPVRLVQKKQSELHPTRVHCVGETYQYQTAWKDRSCRFDHMFCFNATAHDFVVFESAADQSLANFLQEQNRPFHHISSSMHRLNQSNSVSLGGVNKKWGKTGISRLQWFPRIIPLNNDDNDKMISYYELPDTTILIPFHSMNGANPGHLVWDDYLPIFTILKMFQLLPDEKGDDDNDENEKRQQKRQTSDLLPLRFVLQDNEPRGLWASCDLRAEKVAECRHMMTKFWPLLVGMDSPYHFASSSDGKTNNNKNETFASSPPPPLLLELSSQQPLQSDLVCARTGVAGLGSLTDHGLYKAHGWEEEDYKIVHNSGRGGSLYEFRNFMVRNMVLFDDGNTIPIASSFPKPPFRIVFSQRSSDIFIRSMDFAQQIALVKQNFPDAIVENYIFKEMTVREQLQVATQTSVYITLCGGGAVTAMFLPKGASVIVYYADDGGVSNGKLTHKPALLDWDLLNAMSYLRVHWIPRNSRRTSIDDTALVLLIQHELEIMAEIAANKS